MAFTTDELSQMKYHMGYGNLTVLAMPYVEFAIVFNDVVQNNCESWGENYVRTTILPNLNQLEQDIMTQRTRRQATALTGGMQLDQRELDHLLDVREFFISALERAIKVPRAKMACDDGGCDVDLT